MKRFVSVVWLVAAALGYPFSAPADVITEWNSAILDAIRNESTAPPLAARNLAILHAAVFDAVNAIQREYEPYLFSPNPPSGCSPEAAAVGAAYQSLVLLYPSQAALFEATLGRTFSPLAPGQSRDDGFTLGQLVALLTLAWRSSDGASTTVPYIPGTAPGNWRRTPPFFRPPELPQWPYVVPFALTNGAQFRPSGPPSLTSSQYSSDFTLVKELGALHSTNRTPEQTLIARFWSDFSFTVTPPGHWNQIAQNVAANQTNTLAQNARLFALLNIALADAAIVAWDAKYAYNFWRPVTAIQEADTDGNPDTEADPDWLPLLNTPPFPEYVSGHSTFSSAAATVLTTFYGTDQMPFTAGSDTLPGVVRTYTSFEAAAEEIGMSRIYGGFHFLAADLDGLEAGHRVGEYVFQNFLRPVPERPFLKIARRLLDSRMEIAVAGTPGRTYVLESSSDLTYWTTCFTNAAPFTFEEPQPAEAQVRYYRAVAIH